LTASNSIFLPNPYLPAEFSYYGVTDDGTNVQQSPIFTSRAAPVIVIPYIDDYVNLSVAQAVANAAASYGFHITYALNTVFVTAQDWTTIAALEAAGNEIAAHTRTHSDLAYLNVFTIQYTGSASTATLTINVPARTIQSFLNGSSTPDLNISIPDFYPAAWMCNDIAATKGYTCSQPNQSWWTQPFSSQTYFNPLNLADVSGVNIKTPYTAVADPTRYYPYEIQGSQSDIETNIPGYQVTTFATPYSSFNGNVLTLIQDAGFALNRNVLNNAPQDPTSFRLSSLNLYNIAALIPADIDTTNVQLSVDALVEGLGGTGGVFAFYAHGYDEFTLDQWNAFFAELKAIGATCMTASEAVAYVKSHGSLVADGTGKYWNSSIVPSPNYAPTSSSPSQGAHLQ
jgi:peptidoglycan/xylan/chitin deacetylase (PgdA/CDA1 family)